MSSSASSLPVARVGIILGSTRPTRSSPHIAAWIQHRLALHPALTLTHVQTANDITPLTTTTTTTNSSTNTTPNPTPTPLTSSSSSDPVLSSSPHLSSSLLYRHPTHSYHLSPHVLDLRSWNLPLLDEAEEPIRAHGHYQHEHTRQWSQAISTCHAFIFLTPQYNWGYTAPMKNAIDMLFDEWKHRPTIIVSYAHRGGGKANDQLRQVLEASSLKMIVTPTAPQLTYDERWKNAQDELPVQVADEKMGSHIPTLNEAIQQMLELLTKSTILFPNNNTDTHSKTNMKTNSNNN